MNPQSNQINQLDIQKIQLEAEKIKQQQQMNNPPHFKQEEEKNDKAHGATNFKPFINQMMKEREEILGVKEIQSPVETDGFVHINPSEAQMQLDYNVEKNISAFTDLENDSVYPLMTSDPKKQKEYTLKITDTKLNNVFDKQNKDNFNLQSIMIQDYIPDKPAKWIRIYEEISAGPNIWNSTSIDLSI